MQKATINGNLTLDYAGNEAINTICSNLSFAGKNIKKIVITSCEPNDGKSFVAIHTAINMAKRGKRVVLVDDIFTSGSTLSACAGALKTAGAERVFFLTGSIVP